MKIIKKMCLIAVLAGMSVALDLLQNYVQAVKIALYAIPLIFAGFTMDLKSALITGVLAGTVQQLISPFGISYTSFLWALAPISWSVVSCLLFKLIKIENKIERVVFIVTICSIVALILNTGAMFVDPYYTGSYILSMLPERLISMTIMIAPYSLIMRALYKPAEIYRKAFE